MELLPHRCYTGGMLQGGQVDGPARLWHAIRGQGDAIVALLAAVVIVTLFVLAPGTLLDKADRAAYAVCHRLAGHSFVIAGRQLPLCARCSGTYLGALAAGVVLVVRGRGRATRLPGRKFSAVLGVFVGLWAIDGLNSYATLFPIVPHLYEPHNLLRLATGTLEGVTIGALLLPVANLSFWPAADAGPSIASWQDMAWLLVGAAAVIALVDSEWAPLLYPLALLSGMMVLALVGLINALVVLLALRREGCATSWRSLAAPLVAGLALALAELAAIGIGRDWLTQALGLPF